MILFVRGGQLAVDERKSKVLENETLYEFLDVVVSEKSLIKAIDKTQICQDPKALNLQTYTELTIFQRTILNWEVKNLNKVLWQELAGSYRIIRFSSFMDCNRPERNQSLEKSNMF